MWTRVAKGVEPHDRGCRGSRRRPSWRRRRSSGTRGSGRTRGSDRRRLRGRPGRRRRRDRHRWSSSGLRRSRSREWRQRTRCSPGPSAVSSRRARCRRPRRGRGPRGRRRRGRARRGRCRSPGPDRPGRHPAPLTRGGNKSSTQTQPAAQGYSRPPSGTSSMRQATRARAPRSHGHRSDIRGHRNVRGLSVSLSSGVPKWGIARHRS